MEDKKPLSLTDRELLHRMQLGDTGALGVLYVRYAGKVADFASKFIRDSVEVEDITHNIFLSLWENREKMQDVDSLKAYLFMMTRNAIFMVFRHRKIATEWETDTKADKEKEISDGEKIVTTADLLEMIELLISNMPELQQKIFRMSRYDHKTYNEIAEELGMSPKTVQRYIGLALAELRRLVEAMLIFTTLESFNYLT